MQRRVAERAAGGAADGLTLGPHRGGERIDLGLIEVADLEREHDLPGNHVGRAGEGLHTAHGAHLAAWGAGDGAVHHVDVARRGQQAVAPVGHGRGAGVIGDAFGRHLPLADADDAFHHADIQLLPVEIPALLDVQLHVRGHIALGALHRGELRQIAAHERDAVADRLAAAGRDSQILRVHFADECATAHGAAFLVLEDHHLERMPRDEVAHAQRARHFDGAQRAHVAVVVAAGGHRVDV